MLLDPHGTWQVTSMLSSHFTAEETEAQRVKELAHGHPAGRQRGLVEPRVSDASALVRPPTHTASATLAPRPRQTEGPARRTGRAGEAGKRREGEHGERDMALQRQTSEWSQGGLGLRNEEAGRK